MQLGIPLHKLDAGEVLPVAHGLFEERLVGAAKNAIDLVGDDPVVPGAFLTHSHSSPVAVLVGLTFGQVTGLQDIHSIICPKERRWG